VRSVELVEVAPRDGLQNDPADLPATAKVELVARVAAAGARRVEVASFVSPKAVPKMADAEAVVAGVRALGLVGVSLIGLVVNERGVARAAAAGVDEVNAVVVATDTFNRRNQGVPTSETLARLPELLGAAHAAGMRASVTVAAAFGCPFEGEVAVGRLVEVVAAVAGAGPEEVALADSIGVAVPADVAMRIPAVREVIGSAVPLRAHFHDTRNTAVANALAAVDLGVTALDASLGGLGGCPFAPAATGNVPTEDLVYALTRSGVAHGLDLDSLVASSRWLEGAVGHRLPAALPRAGGFPPPPTSKRVDGMQERSIAPGERA
jgi:hydroxymethylglutaryl-CoA lyase